MNRHRKTDPACTFHQPPTGRVSKWFYDRARGESCVMCMPLRARKWTA